MTINNSLNSGTYIATIQSHMFSCENCFTAGLHSQMRLIIKLTYLKYYYNNIRL